MVGLYTQAMIFTTKSGYALRAIVRLAQNYGSKSYSLKKISEEEGISYRYLEKLFRDLKKENLVISVKGSKGGYKLAKSPKSITVYDVIKASDWKTPMFYCVDTSDRVQCKKKDCLTKNVWLKINNELIKTLKKIKLSEIIK